MPICSNCSAELTSLQIKDACWRCGAPLGGSAESSLTDKSGMNSSKEFRLLRWLLICTVIALFPLALTILSIPLSHFPRLSGVAEHLAPAGLLVFATGPGAVVLFVVGVIVILFKRD